MKKDLKLLLLDYKLSIDNLNLQKSVIIKSEPVLIAIVNHFKKFYTFIDFEEVLNMGRMFLLEAIKAFMFYCPYCAKIAFDERAFRLHLIRFHPDQVSSSPAVPVDKFVCYYIGRKIQQYLDKEKKFKSRLVETGRLTGLIDAEDFSTDNGDKLDKIIINDLFEKIMPSLTARQKIIVKGLANGKLQKEVAKQIKRKEGLKTLNSATVIVNRELKDLKLKYKMGDLL